MNISISRAIIFAILFASYGFSQNSISGFYEKYPETWENFIDVSVEVSKKESYEGEHIILYLFIKNISDETRVIPKYLFEPLLLGPDNRIHWLGNRSSLSRKIMLVLFPGEESVFVFSSAGLESKVLSSGENKYRSPPGLEFKVLSSGEIKYRFPAGNYSVYSKYYPDRKTQFKIKTHEDEKSFGYVKYYFDNYVWTPSRDQKEGEDISYILDNLASKTSQNIVRSEIEYRKLAVEIRNSENFEQQKQKLANYIKSFPEYYYSINLIGSFEYKYRDNKNLFGSEFIDQINSTYLKQYFLWEKSQRNRTEEVRKLRNNAIKKLFEKADNLGINIRIYW